ncbi:MAG TPA: histidine phosphatase family protein [Kofleriaceae bacterium]|nr:histidine phosphatase family protein [Kofleriaceae bacterium]
MANIDSLGEPLAQVVERTMPLRRRADDEGPAIRYARRIRILLIRHGESEMNLRGDLVGGFSPETPLTELGRAQAAALGAHLEAERIVPDEIHVSPATRTRETARIALATLGSRIEPREDLRLAELRHGVWEGRSRREAYPPEVAARIMREQMDFKLEGGESMREVSARMRSWSESVLARAPRTVLAFGHSMAIRCLLATLFDWTHDRTYQTVTANTSISAIAYEPGRGWTLEHVGATPHL